MYENELEKKARELPDHLRRQVIDFIDFIAMKHKEASRKSGGFAFNWEGGLSELRNTYDAVGLQHAASGWR